MATIVSSPFNPATSRPHVSSPLACAPPTRTQPRPLLAAKRPLLGSQPSSQQPAHLFPTSRPLRPFPSIANSVSRPNGAARKPTKIIEPPKNFKSDFVLNLTQAELSRQD